MFTNIYKIYKYNNTLQKTVFVCDHFNVKAYCFSRSVNVWYRAKQKQKPSICNAWHKQVLGLCTGSTCKNRFPYTPPMIFDFEIQLKNTKGTMAMLKYAIAFARELLVPAESLLKNFGWTLTCVFAVVTRALAPAFLIRKPRAEGQLDLLKRAIFCFNYERHGEYRCQERDTTKGCIYWCNSESLPIPGNTGPLERNKPEMRNCSVCIPVTWSCSFNIAVAWCKGLKPLHTAKILH